MIESIVMTLARAIDAHRKREADQDSPEASCRWCNQSWEKNEGVPNERHGPDCVYTQIAKPMLAEVLAPEQKISLMAHALFDNRKAVSQSGELSCAVCGHKWLPDANGELVEQHSDGCLMDDVVQLLLDSSEI